MINRYTKGTLHTSATRDEQLVKRYTNKAYFWLHIFLPVFPVSVVIRKVVICFRRPVQWAICFCGSLSSVCKFVLQCIVLSRSTYVIARFSFVQQWNLPSIYTFFVVRHKLPSYITVCPCDPHVYCRSSAWRQWQLFVWNTGSSVFSSRLCGTSGLRSR